MNMSPIDHRLTEIDNALYRIATRVLVIKDDKVLLVREKDADWWNFPGGGIDYGETIHEALIREVVEELGVSPERITVNDTVAFISIGAIAKGIPRCNLFYRVTVPEGEIKPTADVFEQHFFSLDEFQNLPMGPMTDDVTVKLRHILRKHT
jgi:8-oxo-dGTP pyrophosphatase MutT (NUDIX family)